MISFLFLKLPFINGAAGRDSGLTSVYQSFAFTATTRKLHPNLAKRLRAATGAVKTACLPYPSPKWHTRGRIKQYCFLTRKLCCVRSRIRPMQNLNLIVISVAVAHEYAQFTNHCTRRKGNVKAQPTNPKMLKMKRQHEKLKLSKYHRARHVF